MIESRKNPPPHIASSSALPEVIRGVGRLLLQLQRRERDDDDPLAGDDRERPLALLVVGAAELEDLDGPPADLLLRGRCGGR